MKIHKCKLITDWNVRQWKNVQQSHEEVWSSYSIHVCMYQWLSSSGMLAGFELRRAPSPPTNCKAISDLLTGVHLGFAWSGLLSNCLNGRRQPEGRNKGPLFGSFAIGRRFRCWNEAEECMHCMYHTARACVHRKKDKDKDKWQEGTRLAAHTNQELNRNQCITVPLSRKHTLNMPWCHSQLLSWDFSKVSQLLLRTPWC